MKTAQAKIKRCRKGHRMTPENTYPRRDGYVACRDCMLAADKRYRQKLKQEQGGE